MTSTRYVFLVFLAITTVRGQQRPLPHRPPVGVDFAQALQAGTRSSDGMPGKKAWDDHSSYKIVASLDPKTARLSGSVAMVYENRSPKPLSRLMVHLRQNLHRAGALRNRKVEITGGVTVSEVSLDGKRITTSGRRGSYRIDGTIMMVRLRKRLAPGSRTTLRIVWSFTVPRAGHAPRMGQDDHHVFYLGYWYPQFAVRDDVHGWVAEQYLGAGEFYMPYADYDVSLSVPAGFIVRATGEFKNPAEVLPRRIHARLRSARKSQKIVHIVGVDDLGAGKATRRSTKDLIWRFEAKNVRDFAISTADNYLWDATSAKIVDPEGKKRGSCLIHAVYRKSAAKTWNRAAEYGRHTIEFMSKLVYPYPWPHMSLCEGIIGGGMEYPMMTLCGPRFSAPSVQSVIAHELIHMWFPMMVGTNEKARSWMDEGLTSFFTDLAKDDFWKRNNGASAKLNGYRNRARLGRESPAMTHSDLFPRWKPQLYGFATYTKTAAVMHQLRAQLGDEIFWKCMRSYVSTWAFKHPYHHDLFATFSRESGQDLGWYFSTWQYEVWTLDQAVAKVEEREGKSVVTIEDRGLATGPTLVEATLKDGRKERREIPVSHWLSGSRQGTVVFSGEAVEVTIDPSHSTLDIDLGNNNWKRKGD